MKSIYADGIANIQLTDGILRFDLVKINQNPANNGAQPLQPELITTVAMSLPAYVRSYDALTKVHQELLKQKIITAVDPANNKANESVSPNKPNKKTN